MSHIWDDNTYLAVISGRFAEWNSHMTHSRPPVRAPRGTELNAKSWQTEGPLRMLMNNLDPEVAERPEDLVVYGGTGKAARSWEAYDAIVRTLTSLALGRDPSGPVRQAGGRVPHARVGASSPDCELEPRRRLGDLARAPKTRRARVSTMYGQMTAGSWIYIGTQGILQGTYETFAAVADKRFGGTLAGTLTLTGGAGGMGGAQPLAVTLNDGAVLIVDVDPTRLQRRVDHGYLDEMTRDLEDALERVLAAKRDRRGLSVGLRRQRCRRCSPRSSIAASQVDMVTDQTSAHDPLSLSARTAVSVDQWNGTKPQLQTPSRSRAEIP